MNYFTILFLFLGFSIQAQTTISGTITDTKGIPIEGANVYLDGTYDGASSSTDGTFSFTTTEVGDQVLLVTFLSYEQFSYFGPISSMKSLKIQMKEDINSLDTVVISAGSFEANDNSKVSVLKPLDVVTTASALGDFVGALQTLPGTTTVAEDGRLFVRGGDAGETQIFIDGIRVFTPYTPTANNVPTRGRYSPFLFDGITFSTGGYSAEYGEALSSVLLLNTIDEPDQNKTDISIMSVGGGLGLTRKWEKSSLSISTSYINLAPYIEAFPDRNEWSKPFESFAGEAVYRYRTKDGLFKLYTAYDTSNFELNQEDINLENGFSFGVEQFITDFTEDFTGAFADTIITESYGYDTVISASFVESDIIFSKKIALKVGARAGYTNLVDQFTVSPRISFAYKTGKKSQLSLAYGDFYQNPINDFLKFSQDLEAQKTQHYILNYQYNNNGRIFRAEGYRKEYNRLVTFNTDFASIDSVFENGGDGYAQGLDIFWRDNTSIKNMDYWVSYSFLDTERQYLNFPERATPSFANTHNFSAVAKYFITDWKSQVGFSYQYGSGRSFTNPNISGFLQDETKSFNSISVNWAYLISQQKILYVSVNNILGFNNVNGFQYSDTPNINGVFDRRAITPAADQFFFVGFFWTISDDNNSNQLDNL